MSSPGFSGYLAILYKANSVKVICGITPNVFAVSFNLEKSRIRPLRPYRQCFYRCHCMPCPTAINRFALPCQVSLHNKPDRVSPKFLEDSQSFERYVFYHSMKITLMLEPVGNHGALTTMEYVRVSPACIFSIRQQYRNFFSHFKVVFPSRCNRRVSIEREV